jgi:hypothetical protein
VSDVSVYKWVKRYAEGLKNPEIPASTNGILVVIDEMWHFVNGKTNKVWIWKVYNLDGKFRREIRQL